MRNAVGTAIESWTQPNIGDVQQEGDNQNDAVGFLCRVVFHHAAKVSVLFWA